MLDKIIHFFQEWGNNQLLVALTTFALGLVVALFPKILRLIGRLTTWLWAILRGRGADHDFEKLYLDWLIREHRHLGLLPAQIVAMRWKDRQQFVGLED